MNMHLLGEEKCGVCSKKLVRGDYVYGACHECAKRAIANRIKDAKSFRHMATGTVCKECGERVPNDDAVMHYHPGAVINLGSN